MTRDTVLLDALATDPSADGPREMWTGTEYAHIMVPTASMPKQPATRKSVKPSAK